MLCWLIACVLFSVGALYEPPRVSLISLGLAFLTAGFLAPVL